MKRLIGRTFPLMALAVAAVAAHGQFYKTSLKGGDLALGGTGQFSTIVTSNTTGGTYAIARPTGGFINQQVTNQQQYTTGSAGFLGSIQIHPKPWAGVEFNYGYTHYSEVFQFNYSSTPAQQQVSVPTDAHEATAAYVFHPKHIPFQPFMNVGGGAIDFAPRYLANQWRGTGLVETGFDIPTMNKHLAFRVEGRALIYRSPNFSNSIVSTRSWRVTEEPSLSAVYRF